MHGFPSPGEPVVRLVPCKPLGKRQFGAMKGQIHIDDSFFDPVPEEELDVAYLPRLLAVRFVLSASSALPPSPSRIAGSCPPE